MKKKSFAKQFNQCVNEYGATYGVAREFELKVERALEPIMDEYLGEIPPHIMDYIIGRSSGCMLAQKQMQFSMNMHKQKLATRKAWKLFWFKLKGRVRRMLR